MPLSIHIIWAGNAEGAFATRILPALTNWVRFPNRPRDIELFFWTHSSNERHLHLPIDLQTNIQIKYYDIEILRNHGWLTNLTKDLGEQAGHWLFKHLQLVVKAFTFLLPNGLGARASITLKEIIAMWIGGVYQNSLVVDVGCKPIAKTVWYLGERTYPIFPCQSYRTNRISLVEHRFNPWYKYPEHDSITRPSFGAWTLLPITTWRSDVKMLSGQILRPKESSMIEGGFAWNPADILEVNTIQTIRIDNYAIYNGTNTKSSWFALSYAIYLAPAIFRLMWIAAEEKTDITSMGYGYFSVGVMISALHHGLLKSILPPDTPNLSPYTLPPIPLHEIPVMWDVAPSSNDLETNVAIITQLGIEKSFGQKVNIGSNKVPGWILTSAQNYAHALEKYPEFKSFF